jgi:hypothetical protein
MCGLAEFMMGVQYLVIYFVGFSVFFVGCTFRQPVQQHCNFKDNSNALTGTGIYFEPVSGILRLTRVAANEANTRISNIVSKF